MPTVAESGWSSYEAGAWYGFVVPKGTPAGVVDTLRKATVAAINTPKVRERFANEGAEPIGSTPRDFADMMQMESKRWAEVVKASSISVE